MTYICVLILLCLQQFNYRLHIDDTDDDVDLPLKDRKLPQFIALSSGVSPAVTKQQDLSQSSVPSKPKTSGKFYAFNILAKVVFFV